MSYEINNLSGGFHYYRIISVDRMGYLNTDMEGEMLEVFIEYENINNAASGNKDSTQVDNYMIIAVLLIFTAVASGAYIFKNKAEEVPIDVRNSGILVPVEILAKEEIESGIDEKPSFSILKGSQFSRTVIFVCDGGCQNEFENIAEDESELMCPHCGLIGDSPL